MKKMTAIIIALIFTLSAVGCSLPSGKVDLGNDLMKDIIPQELDEVTVDIGKENTLGPIDFAVRLFKRGNNTNESFMLSPVSVLYALAMTANGAEENTLAQMEDVLGMKIPELNSYLKSYKDALPTGEKYKLSIANSIWLTDDERFTATPNFLQTNADYYGAGIYQVSFNSDTCSDINDWVEYNTDGMIKDILDEIPSDAIMYLINAMAFDAEWQEIYKSNQIRDGIFTTEKGEAQNVQMMHSEEHLYLSDANSTGFIKYYADSKYAFVALLPKEGMSVNEYIEALDGESLASMLENAEKATVIATMPKFESEYSVEMKDILISMGMSDAFDSKNADFSALGSSTVGNIFISRVLHKTFIAVDERGTRAGAATVVEMEDEGAMMPDELKYVTLDRPFVYMIIDTQAKLPLFMGAMMNVG